MSTGHGNAPDGRAATPRAISVPGIESVPVNGARIGVRPAGTAPGCHVRTARPSSLCTAPAASAVAVSEPTTGAGTGAAATGCVGPTVAEAAPPTPVAVTVSMSVAPMSPGVSVYVEPVAPAIGAQAAPAPSQRVHW